MTSGSIWNLGFARSLGHIDCRFTYRRPQSETTEVAGRVEHDPKIDDPGLDAALRSNCFYIGALGSRKTHGKRVERLVAAGFDGEAIERIHAPIGLDIGAVSPAEIALSILAEIVHTLRGPRRRPA